MDAMKSAAVPLREKLATVVDEQQEEDRGKVKIGQQQQLAEGALPLLLAKSSAGKQSENEAQHRLTLCKAMHLLAAIMAPGEENSQGQVHMIKIKNTTS